SGANAGGGPTEGRDQSAGVRDGGRPSGVGRSKSVPSAGRAAGLRPVPAADARRRRPEAAVPDGPPVRRPGPGLRRATDVETGGRPANPAVASRRPPVATRMEYVDEQQAIYTAGGRRGVCPRAKIAALERTAAKSSRAAARFYGS